MNINMTYVWAGILGYSALVMLALAFNHGAHRRRPDPQQKMEWRRA